MPVFSDLLSICVYSSPDFHSQHLFAGGLPVRLQNPPCQRAQLPQNLLGPVFNQQLTDTGVQMPQPPCLLEGTIYKAQVSHCFPGFPERLHTGYPPQIWLNNAVASLAQCCLCSLYSSLSYLPGVLVSGSASTWLRQCLSSLMYKMVIIIISMSKSSC